MEAAGCYQCEHTHYYCPEGERLDQLRLDAWELCKEGELSERAYRWFLGELLKHVYGRWR